MLNFAVILEDAARAAPHKTAIAFVDRRWTFKEIDDAARRVAGALKAMGVRAGDRVALSCPNLPAFPMVMFGILKAGAVFTPLNILLKPQEIAYHLADSGAKAYFCFEGNEALPIGAWGHEAFQRTTSCEQFIVITADPAAPSPIDGAPTLAETMAGQAPQAQSFPSNADDTALIIYTSGTTGDPKGAALTHANVMMNTYLLRDLMQYRSDEVSLIALPLFHIFGLVVQLTAGVFAGVTSVLMARFDPETALRLMLEERVSVFCGAPTIYWALLHHQSRSVTDFSAIGERLRCCVSAGQSMPGETLRAFEKRFHTTIIEGYGMSETSPAITFNRFDVPRKIGSVGTPIWGVEVKVVDDAGRELSTGEAGEILVRGHNV
jgi:long-chain acyl-CoA synthetase